VKVTALVLVTASDRDPTSARASEAEVTLGSASVWASDWRSVWAAADRPDYLTDRPDSTSAAAACNY
jgi:hypothetical protein